MAEDTQKITTFKWGNSEYSIDDLLKAHAQYKYNFQQFARDKGKYSGEALNGLMSAIDRRIQAVKDGTLFDADGALPTDMVDNATVEVKLKGLFRKAQYAEQDNTEWAKYYLNKLVALLTPYKKPEDPNSTWDMSKHGLGAYLKENGLDAKDIFENLDMRVAGDNSNNKPTSQRFGLLLNYLKLYKRWVEGKNFDFTLNTNEFDDNFLEKLNALIDLWDTAISNPVALGIALKLLGIGDDFKTAFTSTRFDLDKSDELWELERELAETKERAEHQLQLWENIATAAYNAYIKSNPKTSQFKFSDYTNDFYFDDGEFDKYNQDHYIESADPEHWTNLVSTFNLNPFNDPTIASIVLPLKAHFNHLKEISEGNYAGWLYDPDLINMGKFSVLAVNPTTGEYKEIFIGDVPEKWLEFERNYLIKNGIINPAADYFQEGGVVRYQQNGGLTPSEEVRQYYKQRNAQKAKANGNTEEVQKARDRIVSNGDDSLISEKPSVYDPDAGFTTAERVRLGSILADVTSMFLDPVSGAVVGVGSTAANLYSDIADDGFLWGDVGNFVINLGLDVLGMIPVLGDAVGTGTKITRKLIKYAPRFLSLLAASNGIANAGGMATSWKKLLSEDNSQKLTVLDWRNIAQSISLFTGGVRAAKGKVRQNKMKQAAKVDDALGINVVNNKTSEVQKVLVDGEVAKKIKESDMSAKKVAEILNEHPTFKGQFADGTYSVNSVGRSLQSPIGKKNAELPGDSKWGWRGFRKDGKADISSVYNLSRIPNGYGRSIMPGVRDAHASMIRRLGKENTLDIRSHESDIKRMKESAVAQAKKVGDFVQHRAKKVEQMELHEHLGNKELGALNSRIKKIDGDAISARKNAVGSEILRLQSDIDSNTSKLNDALKRLEQLRQTKRNKTPNKAEIKAQEDVIILLNKTLESDNASLKALQNELNYIDNSLKDLDALSTEAGSVQRAINRRKEIREKHALSSEKHSKPYQKLQDMIAEYLNTYKNSNKEITWDINEIFKAAGLDPKAMFRLGGSVDRNKIYKFLNYAKR